MPGGEPWRPVWRPSLALLSWALPAVDLFWAGLWVALASWLGGG